MMRRRVLTFLLTGLVLLGSVFSCLPLRASAIVPLGFVQSALASYVSSTGYKLYNDNGTGEDILGSLGELYDDYVTISNKTITGQLANLAFLANSPYIYQDNSGQIVISKVAADIFQDFSDWIQSEYSVPIGSDVPTSVLSGSGSSWSDGSGVVASCVSYSETVSFDSYPNTAYIDPDSYCTRKSDGAAVYFGSTNSRDLNCKIFFTKYNGNIYVCAKLNGARIPSFSMFVKSGSQYSNIDAASLISQDFVLFDFVNASNYEWNFPVSTVDPSGINNSALEEEQMSGLLVSLAQAVADVIGQANEDDAVVIGVGASVGATAQDIADMVAQGVKAQTLDPSVSITAESVIDTPVQPYPDIDGLGLPELGAGLVSRFPFCIPWDFVDTVKLLNADPVAPDIAVDLFPAAFKSKVGVTGSTEFRINLGDEKYQKIGTFCRWGSLIGFCFGLAMLTKRMIWTA